MDSDREKKDFIKFIMDATLDAGLATRFLRENTASGVHEFFQQEGYKDIPLEDCEDILNASTSGHGRGIDDAGNPVDLSDATKSY